MNKFIAVSAVALFAATAVPAHATDDVRCRAEPGAPKLSVQAVSAKVEAMGYTVREVEMDDGCYEVEGRDRNGAKVEFKLHPVTGEIVKRD
ncbi:MAG: PepSY domain-containing protein [Hyphomicrobiales bacterium]